MESPKSYAERSLEKHEAWRGKIEISARSPVGNRDELSLAYTPGVAEPCLRIHKDPDLSYTYTRRWNLCLVVTDGSAVLGLGNIGPLAAMPVMEGKCALFKAFGGVDAFPLCVKSNDVDEICRTIELISGSFGGVNLEDIAAPRCFEIEERLKKSCDIPIFHDDQHGTAVVTYAALINAMRLLGRRLEEMRIVMNGAGAASLAIAQLLIAAGAKDISLCDSRGLIYQGRPEGMNPLKEKMAALTNPRGLRGGLAEAVKDADIFIGVSVAHVLTGEMVRQMRKDSIIFACANPTPEIEPDEAKAAGARIIATGRSDYPNQINNVLAFPGIFRGAFDCRAREINDEMNLAAARAIADLVPQNELCEEKIMPAAFDPGVASAVARAVADAARKTGVARI